MPLRITELFKVNLPIIQAPMAGVQGAAMAVAVSQAGGLGSLPCAMLSSDALREALQIIRAQTDKPFNVNFFCHEPPSPDAQRETAWRALLAPYFAEYKMEERAPPSGASRQPFNEEMAELLAPFKPPVVSFHFGLPTPDLMAKVRSWGAKIISSATTVAEAQWLQARGVDAIIAQGLEAGGHRGMFLNQDLSTQIGTMALVPQIVRAVNLPVIAAGGIADAHGVAAAMALGASGAQIGTSYLLCKQAMTSTVHRAALQSEMAQQTALTNLFTGRPARGILNRLMREMGPMHDAVPTFPLASNAIAALRQAAEQQGRTDFSPLWAGQNVTGCRDEDAGLLTQSLASSVV